MELFGVKEKISNCIIRPPRAIYDIESLGDSYFTQDSLLSKFPMKVTNALISESLVIESINFNAHYLKKNT